MADTRTEIIDEVEVKIVEDTREDIHDFLGQAQEIESYDEKKQEEELNKIFGSEDSENDGDEKEETKETTPEQEKRKQELEERAASSRASSDVALAMMLADQAAASPTYPCYVVHGAKMICSMGSREARLVVPLDHGTCLTKTPQMIDEDYHALENVKCFGNCFSPDNPNMEQAAIEMTNQYNEEKSQTWWGKVKGFFGVKPKVVDSVSEELTAACICECSPVFVEKWSDGNEKSLVDGKNTLIQTCTLVCQYGGIVRIVDNGQEQ